MGGDFAGRNSRTGSPSLPLIVAQGFSLRVFPVRIGRAPPSLACATPQGGAAGRGHAQKPVRRVPRGGRSKALEPKLNTSRRRRACRRPAAVALHRARIKCDPYESKTNSLAPVQAHGMLGSLINASGSIGEKPFSRARGSGRQQLLS